MSQNPTQTTLEFSSRARKTTVVLSLERTKSHRKVTAKVFHAEFTTHAKPGSVVVSPSGAVELRAETRTGKDEPKGNFEMVGFYHESQRAENAHVYKAIDYLGGSEDQNGLVWTRFFPADQPFLSESLDEMLYNWHLAEKAKEPKKSEWPNSLHDTVDAMQYAVANMIRVPSAHMGGRRYAVAGMDFGPGEPVAVVSANLMQEAEAALDSPEPNISQMKTITKRLIAALDQGKMNVWGIDGDAAGTSVVTLVRAPNVAFPLGGR